MTGQVLIVDDDPDVRELLRESLELAGTGVVEASNGREALELMSRTEGLRLILLDLRMPVMDGAEFLEAKSALTAFDALPVVIISATDPARVVLAKTAGFLKKPFDLDALLELVRRFTA
jgi:CheY-like chemotaxis protein